MWRTINASPNFLPRLIQCCMTAASLCCSRLEHSPQPDSIHYRIHYLRASDRGIGIVDPVKGYSPLARHIFHLKPFVVSIVISSSDFQSISFAFHWLIIRPFSSSLDIIFRLIKLNITFWVEIFRAKMKIIQIRVQL